MLKGLRWYKFVAQLHNTKTYRVRINYTVLDSVSHNVISSYPLFSPITSLIISDNVTNNIHSDKQWYSYSIQDKNQLLIRERIYKNTFRISTFVNVILKIRFTYRCTCHYLYTTRIRIYLSISLRTFSNSCQTLPLVLF